MGFYGNLTNTARTQFQFDKIYPNRYSMERNINNDGIYLGRYVLVEYDADIHEDHIKTAYLSNNNFYTTVDFTQNLIVNKYVIVAAGTVNEQNFKNYFVKEGDLHYPAAGYDAETAYYELQSGNLSYGVEIGEIIQTRAINGTLTGQFWRCTGEDTFGYAVFEEITEETVNNYLINYNIDISYFGPREPEGAYSRAWDSTVWQKIYAQGEIKYVMIAELNTASPSFSIAYDAPTQTPLAPHVDASSANNVYRVHLQPTWGFRIKEAENEDESDIKVAQIISNYDIKTNQINQVQNIVNGDIFWNKAGLNISQSVHVEGKDYITLLPTGQSGLVYNSHKGYIPTTDSAYAEDKNYYTYSETFDTYDLIDTASLIGIRIDNEEEQVYEYNFLPTFDTNELSIHLPSVGNAVADLYDLMFGYNAANRNMRYRDVDWKYYHNGILDPQIAMYGGMTRDIKTFAGTLNHIHDLMGMIIYVLDSMPNGEMVQALSSEFIYKIQNINRYYYRSATYAFDSSKVPYDYILVDTTNEEYIQNCYFTLPTGSTFNANNLTEDLGENSFSADKDYYKRLIHGPTYKEIGYLTNYYPNTFYYQLGANYLCEDAEYFNEDRAYYSMDQSWKYKQVTDDELLEEYHHYFFLTPEWDLEDPVEASLAELYGSSRLIESGWNRTSDIRFSSEKAYYTINVEGLLVPYIDYTIDDLIPNDIIIAELVDTSELDPDTITVGDIRYPVELSNYCDYLWTENSIPFKTSYQANTFWYRSEGEPFSLVENGPSYPYYTYTLDENNRYTIDREYYLLDIMTLPTGTELYRPNIYVYFDNDDGINSPFNPLAQPGDADYAGRLAHSDSNTYPTMGRYYWNVVLSDGEWVMNEYNELIYIRHILSYQRANVVSVTGQYITYDETLTQNVLVPTEPVFNYYYATTENGVTVYSMLHPNNLNVLNRINAQPYYINVTENTPVYSNTDFYLVNMYYYFNGKDLLMDNSPILTEGRYYYAPPIDANTGLLQCITPIQFYSAEQYYYQIGSSYVLDTNILNEDEENRIYYEKEIYRVEHDTLGIYSTGAAWNIHATLVPCTITLGVTEPWYELKELGNVGTDRHSLNGLILAYNKFLSNGDSLSRSTNSMQGTLNLYKDTINKVDADIIPDRIITSDLYGRMTSSNLSINNLIDRIDALETRIQELENA